MRIVGRSAGHQITGASRSGARRADVPPVAGGDGFGLSSLGGRLKFHLAGGKNFSRVEAGSCLSADPGIVTITSCACHALGPIVRSEVRLALADSSAKIKSSVCEKFQMSGGARSDRNMPI